MIKKIFLLIFTSIILVNCADIDEETLIGKYVSKNNINTIDSLWILKDGNYINKMYRKQERTLVYKNTGTWEFSEGCITFKNFFVDEDEVHSIEVTNYEDVLITSSFYLESRFGKIIIHHKSMYDNIYLEKID